MITAISQQPASLKVVVNNHSITQQRALLRMPLALPVKRVSLKGGELIATTAFNMLGIREDILHDNNKLDFWDKCRQQKLTGPGTEAADSASTLLSINQVRQTLGSYPEIKEGRTVWSNTGEHPFELLNNVGEHVIALSKVYNNKEFVVVYNTSVNEPVETCVKLNSINPALKYLQVLYGYENCGNVQVYNTVLQGEKISYIKLYLKPMHLVILKNF